METNMWGGEVQVENPEYEDHTLFNLYKYELGMSFKWLLRRAGLYKYADPRDDGNQ